MSVCPELGGVYSVVRGAQNRFGVAKVLALVPNKNAVHVKVFKRCVNVRPDPAWFEDTVRQSPKALDDILSIGIGVLPITLRVFEHWQPELIFVQPLSDSERRLSEDIIELARPWDDLKYA